MTKFEFLKKKQLKEEEEKRRKQREIEQKQQSGTNISDSTQPKKPQINQEEINRLREMEKVRNISFKNIKF